MEIKQETRNQKGSFKAFEGNQQAGVLDYRMEEENRMVIDHTEVAPEFEGKGLGKKLVMEAVEFARQENLKIVPLCSYANAVFSRTEEIRDVLHTSSACLAMMFFNIQKLQLKAINFVLPVIKI